MSCPASSLPPRKKQRLSSPTYDAHSIDLNSDDFQILDDIEARLSQEAQALRPSCESVAFASRSDYVLGAKPEVSRTQSQTVGLEPDVLFRPAADPTPTNSKAVSESAQHVISTTPLLTSPTNPIQFTQHNFSLKKLPEQALEWPAASGLSHFPGFAPASLPNPDHPGPTSTTKFRLASDKDLAFPSAKALEAAKTKLQVWEAEIETELSAWDRDEDLTRIQNQFDREPLVNLENSVAPLPLPAAGFGSSSTKDGFGDNPLVSLKSAGFVTPLRNHKLSSIFSRPHISNPIIARSSAASFLTQSSPLKVASSPTPGFTSPSNLLPVTAPKPLMLSRLTSPDPVSSSSKGSPKAKPLGLTPRAQSFTSSKVRPRFITPFKAGMAPGEQGRKALLHASNPQTRPQPQNQSQGVPSKDAPRRPDIFNPIKLSQRQTLADCGLTPRPFTKDKLITIGFDIEIFNLTSVSHFLYYRFNCTGTNSSTNDYPSTQTSFGVDSALAALLTSGCHLATKAWVDNHWLLVLWKLLGMCCLDPMTFEKRWCWAEVTCQLRYRYLRELANGVRPALRLITTHDAPSSGPLVLCVSDIFWTDEHVDTDGRLIPAHPELELTDGWYRLRTTVDEALARATRNRTIRVGRKIACSGAKLESSKKGPMEVLDAYESMHLVLSGNSTHLAPWHAKLGFQSTPFFATLRSLSPDGGSVALMDLLITHVYPVAYIEYITAETGENIRVGPRNEKEEAQEEDKWKARRAQEAMKLWDELEMNLYRLESYAEKLERVAGGPVQSLDDDSPPDNIESLAEELEDSEDPASLLKGLDKKAAVWLAYSLRKKCEIRRERGSDEIDQELAVTFPPRQVRNFRILRVQDARTARKPSTRTAQLTVWDVMSLNVTEEAHAGSFASGQRFLVANLVASQPGAWMGLEPGSEIFLATKRDSKWKMIR